MPNLRGSGCRGGHGAPAGPRHFLGGDRTTKVSQSHLCASVSPFLAQAGARSLGASCLGFDGSRLFFGPVVTWEGPCPPLPPGVWPCWWSHRRNAGLGGPGSGGAPGAAQPLGSGTQPGTDTAMELPRVLLALAAMGTATGLGESLGGTRGLWGGFPMGFGAGEGSWGCLWVWGGSRWLPSRWGDPGTATSWGPRAPGSRPCPQPCCPTSPACPPGPCWGR